ncbi:PP2C family protein-serine/threonine phosphatase [Acetobacterium malicum]|uniref:SpoIIE family protein phosphatase n=1 Tax=Acetobacterium malicum TaxID=52692 RepID=A0ABR6YV22_9FIRM|nr:MULTISPECIES: PP2C family protein-serine/threonine phosphatase [Acetobacterium]MBC3898971.1 SpoIIE family protein phosphatase [Acetobacterium malicum]
MNNSDHYESLVSLFDKQLEFAQNLQKKIIPSPGSFVSDHYHFYSYLRPFRKVGGDFYDFHFMDNGKISLLIADATGHGIDAAMITSMIKLSYSYTMKDNRINQSPSLVLKQIESDISQQMDNTFFTAIALVFDPLEDILYFANAGHPDAVLLKASHKIELLKPNLPMLGLQQFMTTMHYFDMRINFSRGDKLLLFTDGLIDAKNPDREEFSMERVLSVIKKNADSPINLIGSHIIDACVDFKREQAPSDDICILGIEVDD